jgi:5-formyltetrahydrofolate cyclo-ligase
MRRILNSISPADIDSRSVAMCERLELIDGFRQAKGISCFISKPAGEVQTSFVLRKVLEGEGGMDTDVNKAASKRVFIPKVTGSASSEMLMLELPSMEELENFPRNKWGIPEPPHVDFDATPTGIIDLVLVPGVVFDHSCQRVGHGRGYYDSFLKRLNMARAFHGLPKPLAIGLCFDDQLLPAGQYVPLEDHDVPLDFIVTPSQIVSARR